MLLLLLAVSPAGCSSPPTPPPAATPLPATFTPAKRPSPPATPTPSPRPTPTATAPTATPVPTPSGEVPPGFLWRIVGGTDGRPALPRGMDIGPDGRLYVANEWAGLLVISPTGEILTTLTTEEAGDVQVARDGILYLALPEAHAVLVLSPQGEVLGRWGEPGTGEGQFGLSSPEHLAVCPDGRVYASDLNERPDGSTYERIQAFARGRFLAAWDLSELDPAFLISGMDCGDDGRLYLLGAVGGHIMVLDGEGRRLEDIGRETLAGSVPQGLALAPSGEIVVGTWSGQVLRLDRRGKRLAVWGEPFSGTGLPDAGYFSIIQDVAVDASGSVYVSDLGGGYAGITCFTFPSP